MLTSTRSFLLLALIGIAAALCAWVITGAMAGASDSEAMLLAVMIAGAGLTAFSLVPPALRLLLRGWARVGIGPRQPRAAARLADMLSLAVWALWIIGAAAALPPAWGPLLANLHMG